MCNICPFCINLISTDSNCMLLLIHVSLFIKISKAIKANSFHGSLLLIITYHFGYFNLKLTISLSFHSVRNPPLRAVINMSIPVNSQLFTVLNSHENQLTVNIINSHIIGIVIHLSRYFLYQKNSSFERKYPLPKQGE